MAALLSCLGTLAFWVWVAPRALARSTPDAAAVVHGLLRRASWVGVAAAAVTLSAWTVLQSAAIAGSAQLAVASVASVLPGTTFGHLALCQAGCLAATALALSWRPWAALGCAAAATALQAGHGHALAMVGGPSLLLLSGVLHLWAAGVWLGGLAPLLLVVHAAPARTAASAARWFSPLGKACIAVLVGSALVQFWQLIGGLPGLVGTAYGWMALAKLGLLVALLAFAAVNRYRLAPRLLRDRPAQARAALVGSIAVQTAVGLLAVLAAAALTSLPPSIHEQPVWPFPLRPSLVVMADPDLRAEILHALAGFLMGAALVLVGAALYRRRVLALAGLGAGLAIGGAAATHFDLLLVEAYPTSYFHSPTGFAATRIAQGAALFPQHCASCHGAQGRGDGPAARGLAVPPADLTAGHLWAHDDGELFWWLTHGIDAPEGGQSMPGFARALTEDDRWALIDYIRAHNAGTAFQDTDAWPAPLQAPGFAMVCAGRSMTTAVLRGSVLHVVTVPGAARPVPEDAGVPVVTVLLTRDAAATAACVARDPAAWRAYATIVGVPDEALSGAQFLVDPNGWVRAAQRSGEAAMRWADPATLVADVQAICRHPIAAAMQTHVHH